MFYRQEEQKTEKEFVCKKIKTIKSSKDFNYIFNNGTFVRLSFINIIFFNDKNNNITGDVGFVASKKNGNAVWRNKNKRKLREIYKLISLENKFKIILIAKKSTINYNNAVIADEIGAKLSTLIKNEK